MPLSSINIGTSGLVGFSRQLETISNNVANLNTPGFKGANSQFSALFSGGSGIADASTGSGLAMLPSTVDFVQGQVSQTGNDLDVAIDGQGFFVLRDDTGALLYTRDGRFTFDNHSVLVNNQGAHVQALGTDGGLHDITLDGVRTNPASASATVKLLGTLSTADATKVVSGITVTDGAGGSHTLSVEFKNNTAVTAGSWIATVKEGNTTVATGEARFVNGVLAPAFSTIAFTYNPAGVAPMPMTFVLDAGTTSAASGASSLAVSSVDGYSVGTLGSATFDTSGKLSLSYSNGQKATPQTLALASFGATSELEQGPGTSFRSKRAEAGVLGVADGKISSIAAESLEGSNVDLSRQFSAIIITQRGYQASSELISTANQMLDTLMHMKG
ncbi:flagellar basal-body rod protein FlgF [Massilia sp. S19_KUP03_FR1]|uniref:flagellar basal-body rod protein FlgF n=1 Tax=Massilia sp. S19_KUP03_FR1 TaxID=3025503 RepID=UPI002FCD8222